MKCSEAATILRVRFWTEQNLLSSTARTDTVPKLPCRTGWPTPPRCGTGSLPCTACWLWPAPPARPGKQQRVQNPPRPEQRAPEPPRELPATAPGGQLVAAMGRAARSRPRPASPGTRAHRCHPRHWRRQGTRPGPAGGCWGLLGLCGPLTGSEWWLRKTPWWTGFPGELDGKGKEGAGTTLTGLKEGCFSASACSRALRKQNTRLLL